jgi:chromosome segregation ATPase
MRDGLAGAIIEDDEAPAPASSSAQSFDQAASLIAIAVDPAGTAKRLKELKDATAKHDASAEQARVEQQRVQSAIADLGRTRAADEKRLADATLAHEQAMERRLRDVEVRESAADKAAAELEQREAKLKADRAKLDKKLAAVREAAGE